jgi:hypothetical protein
MDADQLYGLPLDRFIPERTALARALRTEGRREEASAISQLRKPSVAAWAVNQLARTQRQTLAELLEAGDRLRQAHENVLAGRGDGRALRTALEEERAAVGTLLKAAQGLLSSEGHELSATMIERVADTLHAAALEQDARDAVREGRLERELRHVGLGPAPPLGAEPSPRRTQRRSGTKRGKSPDQGADATKARKAAAAKEADARRLADRAGRALEIAQRRRDRAAKAFEEAEQSLGEAEETLTAAGAAADSATEEHRRARAELDGLSAR